MEILVIAAVVIPFSALVMNAFAGEDDFDFLYMETKLLALMAFGAAVTTLWAWLIANLPQTESVQRK